MTIRKLLLFTMLFCSSSIQALEFSLFADISYVNSDDDDDNNNFVLGPLDLNATQNINPSTYVSTEIFIHGTHDSSMEVEKIFVHKEVSDTFSIVAGKFSKPLGYWNQNFHHGSLSQDTVTRPFFLEYEDADEGIFPAHLVGVDFVNLADDSTFHFSLGNSSGIDTSHLGTEQHIESESQEEGDISSDVTMVLRYTLFISDNTELGLFYLKNHYLELGHEEVDPVSGLLPQFAEHGEVLFEQSVAGLDFGYRGDTYYAFGEFYNVEITDGDFTDFRTTIPDPLIKEDAAYTANAYYFQLGMKATEKLSFAYRYANIDIAEHSPYFELLGVNSETHNVYATSYRIAEGNALRAEYHTIESEENGKESTLALQWFFLVL